MNPTDDQYYRRLAAAAGHAVTPLTDDGEAGAPDTAFWPEADLMSEMPAQPWQTYPLVGILAASAIEARQALSTICPQRQGRGAQAFRRIDQLAARTRLQSAWRGVAGRLISA
jgi:hypothetical protein